MGEGIRVSWAKRIFLGFIALIAFVILCVITIRITISQLFSGGGIESSRVPLAAAWDARSMWNGPMLQKSMGLASPWESAVARNADLMARSDEVRPLGWTVAAGGVGTPGIF